MTYFVSSAELLEIFENINVSACASFHSSLHFNESPGEAFAIILSQCFVSFDSFLEIWILLRKSFLELA